MNPTSAIRRLHDVDEAALEQLVDVLIDCVDGGASVSFMLPLTRERAIAFWRGIAADVASGGRALLVAEDSEGICGTVQHDLLLPGSPRVIAARRRRAGETDLATRMRPCPS